MSGCDVRTSGATSSARPRARGRPAGRGRRPVARLPLRRAAGQRADGRGAGLRRRPLLAGHRRGGRRAPRPSRPRGQAPRPRRLRARGRPAERRHGQGRPPGHHPGGQPGAGRGGPQGRRPRPVPHDGAVRRRLPQDHRGAAAPHDRRDRRRRDPAGAGHHRVAVRPHRLRPGARRRGRRAPGGRGRARGAGPGGGRRPRPATSAGPACWPPTPTLADRREAWRAVPDRLDGTGARVVDLVDDLRRRIDAAQAPLDAQHVDGAGRPRGADRALRPAPGPASPSWSPGTSARSGPCAARRSASAWPPWPAATGTPWPTAATRRPWSTAWPPSRWRPRT